MQAALRSKLISADDAAALVKSGDWIDFYGGLGQPDLFDQALARRKDELRDVSIRSCISFSPRAVIQADPTGEHFLWFNWHFSAYDRGCNVDGRCNYIPMNFGELPGYYRRFVEPPRSRCIKTCPMDEHGYFNFGGSVAYGRALTERAKVVIVETVRGDALRLRPGGTVHVSEVTHVINGGRSALPELPNPAITDVDRKVAALIAAELVDGSCLQIGIGGMPNAVCSALKDAGLKDLGIHTEMFVDGMVDLIEAGIVTGAKKQLNPYQSTTPSPAGSRRMYEFLDRNPQRRGIPSTTRTCPITSCRTTTRVDQQHDADRSVRPGLLGIRRARASSAAPAGSSSSRAAPTPRAAASRSSASPPLTTTWRAREPHRARAHAGNVVTTPRTDVMYVVTEYGIVNLKGKSIGERAKALIALAHPDFREQLERDARECHLVPRTFW